MQYCLNIDFTVYLTLQHVAMVKYTSHNALLSALYGYRCQPHPLFYHI